MVLLLGLSAWFIHSPAIGTVPGLFPVGGNLIKSKSLLVVQKDHPGRPAAELPPDTEHVLFRDVPHTRKKE